jgi:hypothetical protein
MLWVSKVAKVLISRIAKLLTWESWEKRHLDVASITCHKEYYKGEGGGFPQLRAMVSLVNPCMPMVRSCTKTALTMH